MKLAFKNIIESELIIGVAAVLTILGFLYLRNGSEYFSGNSGGAYWDNMNYCRTHRDGRMKVHKDFISCREILSYRKYCRRHVDDSISVEGTTIPCDRFLGIEDDRSPWDPM